MTDSDNIRIAWAEPITFTGGTATISAVPTFTGALRFLERGGLRILQQEVRTIFYSNGQDRSTRYSDEWVDVPMVQE